MLFTMEKHLKKLIKTSITNLFNKIPLTNLFNFNKIPLYSQSSTIIWRQTYLQRVEHDYYYYLPQLILFSQRITMSLINFELNNLIVV